MLECLQLYLDEGFISCQQVNLSNRKLLDETSAEFVDFASGGILFNTEFNLKILYSSFKNHLGFGDDFFNKCPIKQNTFSNYLKVYARFRNVEFRKRHSHNDQYITLVT
jgi:hypothetical protein